MTKYEAMANEIQRQLNDNIITLEEANILNDRAYAKYSDVSESYDDDEVTPDEYLAAIESAYGIGDDEEITPEEYLAALESVHGIDSVDDEPASEADINELKLAAYEACEAGDITFDEREEILASLED